MPREGGRRPPHSGRGSHGCPGSTEHRLGCSLWHGNIFGGALRPHHFPDDLYRPSRIQGPEKVEKIKYWEPEATGWTHFGGVHQGVVSLTAAEVQLHAYPGLSLSDMEGKKKEEAALCPSTLRWLQSATWPPLCVGTFKSLGCAVFLHEIPPSTRTQPRPGPSSHRYAVCIGFVGDTVAVGDIPDMI